MPDDLSDARLEREIAEAGNAMDAAVRNKDKEGFRVAYAKMQELHGQRSARQVEKMEREKGLA